MKYKAFEFLKFENQISIFTARFDNSILNLIEFMTYAAKVRCYLVLSVILFFPSNRVPFGNIHKAAGKGRVNEYDAYVEKGMSFSPSSRT